MLSGSADVRKTRMTLASCTVDAGKVTARTGEDDVFTVMINPASLKIDHEVKLVDGQSMGGTGSELKFSVMNPRRLSFDLVLDGTGVVEFPLALPVLGNKEPIGVEKEIEKLKKIVLFYDGDKHEPNVVKIVWGTYSFEGRLSSFGEEYSMFKPNGNLLRARVSLSFCEFMTREEESRSKDNQSPDMTHLIEFAAGDTLPGLCRRIYGDEAWYLEVARINGLVDFRNIPSGTKLRFPPLK